MAFVSYTQVGRTSKKELLLNERSYTFQSVRQLATSNSSFDAQELTLGACVRTKNFLSALCAH